MYRFPCIKALKLWLFLYIFTCGCGSTETQNKKVHVNFLKNAKGKWISFLNLRASFPDNVEHLKIHTTTTTQVSHSIKKNVDKSDEDDITIITITPYSLLDSIPKPLFKMTTTLVTPNHQINENMVSSFMNLAALLIPLKHGRTIQKIRSTTDNSLAAYSTDSHYPIDDEDYSETGVTIYDSQISLVQTTTMSATNQETTDTISYNSEILTIITKPSKSVAMESNDTYSNESLTYDYESDLFFNENDTIIPTQVLHKDSLHRKNDELRVLLANLENLDMEEDYESYYRDHGASFLLPVLKSTNYDNTSVPIVFPDLPLNVKVSLTIIHLANFDSSQMEYTIDFLMEMRWFDVRLANNYTKPIRVFEKEVMDKIFRPDPYFVNSKKAFFHEVSFPNFRMRIMPTGLVIYTLRITLRPSCVMTFCRFPHDSQQCDLQISSIAYPESHVRFFWSTNAIRFNARLFLPELQIKAVYTEECITEGKLVPSSCLRLRFDLERDGSRYIVEKYVPSTLAMMFAWVAPYVPYNYEDVRIITPITVLLTLVQMEKGDQSVRTSYLTSMDTWFGVMKAFSLLSLMESLIVLALIKRSRAMEKQANRAKSDYIKEIFTTEKRRLTDLYHRLDTVSRFMSPIVFICFFVLYVLCIAQRDESTCMNPMLDFDS